MDIDILVEWVLHEQLRATRDNDMIKHLEYMKYLYKISPAILAVRLFKKVVSPIYRHEIGNIALRRREDFFKSRLSDARNTDCIVCETVESLDGWGKDMPPSIPFRKLCQHLSEKPLSAVILAIRPATTENDMNIVGYRYCQRGVFYFHGLEEALSEDILFVIHTEVLPEFRGQRVNGRMMVATHEYCLNKGLSKIVGVIRTENEPSMKHHMRYTGAGIISKVEIESWFGKVTTSNPPWGELRKTIEDA